MTVAIGGYRKDMCECFGHVECKSCKVWRKKHMVRRPMVHTVSLQERLKIAEEKLTMARVYNDKQKVRNYQSQIRMLKGRMKRYEEYALATE